MENQPQRNLRLVLIICGLLVVGSIFYYYWEYVRLSARLEIQVAPASSTISLNNKTVRAGVYRVSPGSYRVVVVKDGFGSQSQDIKVSKSQSSYLGIVLVSNSNSTANWYINNPSDQQLSEGISSRTFDATSQSSSDKAPIISHLPFISPDSTWRVDYGNDAANPSRPVIYISYTTLTGRQDALDWIKYGGFDISALKVIYQHKSYL